MYLLNHIKQPTLVFFSHFGYAAGFVIRITKHNGVCRTSLRTSGLYFVATKLSVLHFCLKLALLRTLHTEGTLLHYTTAAGGYIRVQHHAGKFIVHLMNNLVQMACATAWS